MKIDWKKLAPYLVALVVFIGFALAYCSPLLDGKVLYAGDVNSWKCAAQEIHDYKQSTGGEQAWWTNSMFGGMPAYQITGNLPSGHIRSAMEKVAHAGMAGDLLSIGLLFAYFLGFFLMLRCFKVNSWLSIIGGLAIGLSTYYMLIIPAGHITKAMAIGFLAPVIGGIYAIFRKDYYLGIPLIFLYSVIGIVAHPQMTYYIMLLVGVMIIAELYIHIRDKKWK